MPAQRDALRRDAFQYIVNDATVHLDQGGAPPAALRHGEPPPRTPTMSFADDADEEDTHARQCTPDVEGPASRPGDWALSARDVTQAVHRYILSARNDLVTMIQHHDYLRTLQPFEPVKPRADALRAAILAVMSCAVDVEEALDAALHEPAARARAQAARTASSRIEEHLARLTPGGAADATWRCAVKERLHAVAKQFEAAAWAPAVQLVHSHIHREPSPADMDVVLFEAVTASASATGRAMFSLVDVQAACVCKRHVAVMANALCAEIDDPGKAPAASAALRHARAALRCITRQAHRAIEAGGLLLLASSSCRLETLIASRAAERESGDVLELFRRVLRRLRGEALAAAQLREQVAGVVAERDVVVQLLRFVARALHMPSAHAHASPSPSPPAKRARV